MHFCLCLFLGEIIYINFFSFHSTSSTYTLQINQSFYKLPAGLLFSVGIDEINIKMSDEGKAYGRNIGKLQVYFILVVAFIDCNLAVIVAQCSFFLMTVVDLFCSLLFSF